VQDRNDKGDAIISGDGEPHVALRVADPLRVRAAIVHDWFQGYHGSERTVEAMRIGLFEPPPDVLTFHAAHELLPKGLSQAIVRESSLARLPGIRQSGHDPGRWRWLLPMMPRYFSRLDVRAYDVVISSSHACAVHVRPREDALHVCYCYTPMRYAWLPETEAGRVGGVPGRALGLLRGRLRRLDLAASRRPDAYVAISSAVRDRIQRFYGRDAEVIHPPVAVDEFRAGEEKESGRFLWAGRFVAYKRPDLVVEAFRGSPHRLTMVGVGPLADRLRATLPPNVELRGWVPREELVELYERASGFVHVGEEDFGIAMVEALAAGTPVVALDAGGARDIVRDGLDGVLIQVPTVEAVRSALEEVADRTWSAAELRSRSTAFSGERFVRELRALLVELGP
jgi:glycosyltransferase involved in cell wall biosynthesis